MSSAEYYVRLRPPTNPKDAHTKRVVVHGFKFVLLDAAIVGFRGTFYKVPKALADKLRTVRVSDHRDGPLLFDVYSETEFVELEATLSKRAKTTARAKAVGRTRRVDAPVEEAPSAEEREDMPLRNVEEAPEDDEVDELQPEPPGDDAENSAKRTPRARRASKPT